MACEKLDCTCCHPPPPDPGRPGWTVTPGGHRQLALPGGGHLAVVPPTGPEAQWFWLAGNVTGREPTLEEAQLAAERAAIPLLRAAADELERGLPCEHGPADQCAACRPGSAESALVEDEREMCADECEQFAVRLRKMDADRMPPDRVAEECAEIIRKLRNPQANECCACRPDPVAP